MLQLFHRFNPFLGDTLNIRQGFFIGLAVRCTARQLRDFGNVGLILVAPKIGVGKFKRISALPPMVAHHIATALVSVAPARLGS